MHCERTALAKSESEDKHDFVRGSIARSIIGRDSGFKYTSTWLTIGSSLDLDLLVVVIVFLRVVVLFLVVFLEKKDDNFLLLVKSPIFEFKAAGVRDLYGTVSKSSSVRGEIEFSIRSASQLVSIFEKSKSLSQYFLNFPQISGKTQFEYTSTGIRPALPQRWPCWCHRVCR